MFTAVARHEVLPSNRYEQLRPRYLRDMVALKQRRRIALGPDVTLVFECRDTVLFQIHEVLRWMKHPGDPQIAREIAEYSPLVSGGARLCATLLIEGGSCAWGQRLGRQLTVGEEVLWLEVDGRALPAAALVPEYDPCCPVHYVCFGLPAAATLQLLERTVTAQLRLRGDGADVVASLGFETRTELAALAGATAEAPSLLALLASEDSVAPQRVVSSPPTTTTLEER